MKRKIFLFLLILGPSFAFAQSSSADDFLDYILTILRAVSSMLGSVAFAFFFYNLIMFIKASNEGKTDLSKSKGMLIWSGIALFMMVGIWSIVAYVQSSLGVDLGNSDITRTPILPETLN